MVCPAIDEALIASVHGGQAMKGVIWILACVVLVGFESRRLDTQRVESSNGVTLELATAVRRALEAKHVEEGRLVPYGVKKQRLMSGLRPDVTGNLNRLQSQARPTERSAFAPALRRVMMSFGPVLAFYHPPAPC
jgi:hypothetical protein